MTESVHRLLPPIIRQNIIYMYAYIDLLILMLKSEFYVICWLKNKYLILATTQFLCVPDISTIRFLFSQEHV